MASIRKGGHRKVFTDAQNSALREALVDLHKKRNLSQTALGAILGIKQQNAGRLLKEDDDNGFSYESGTRLVRYLGFAGVDTFFRSRGVSLPSEPPQARSA